METFIKIKNIKNDIIFDFRNIEYLHLYPIKFKVKCDTFKEQQYIHKDENFKNFYGNYFHNKKNKDWFLEINGVNRGVINFSKFPKEFYRPSSGTSVYDVNNPDNYCDGYQFLEFKFELYEDINEVRNKTKRTTAEDFTPSSLVNEMLDKLPASTWSDPLKTFLDPAAGNGNFLVEILRRKLSAQHDPLTALSTIFGVELMEDNVEEMKDRLLIELPSLTAAEAKRAREIVNKNIIAHDALTWDFENWRPKKLRAENKPLF